METKLVSVIVPVYGTEKYLRRCLDSILNQTYQNIEVIVVNDASKDNSAEIIREYALKDSRIKSLTNENNMGVYLTRIVGVEACKGDYIAFIDSDDYFGVDFIRLLVKTTEENEADIAVGRTVIDGRDGAKYIFSLHDIELMNLPLCGNQIKEHFFAQAGACYAWHTIWNKLYTKELWQKALPYMNKLQKHLIMTEDIIYAVILLCLAEKVVSAENSVYYYCENDGSATDNRKMSYEVYAKKVSDIHMVFDFIDDFLAEIDVTEECKQGFREFRRLYARDWERGIAQLSEREEEALLLIEDFCPDRGSSNQRDDRFFNSIKTPYRDNIEQIKKAIWCADCEYVSFDIFDTAVVRPFADPADLFELLNAEYEKETTGFTSIADLRKSAELGARTEHAGQSACIRDIHIDDIYDYMHKYYGLSETLCSRLKESERKWEISVCRARKTIFEIYELALYVGKKVIFVSDMYLDGETIDTILKSNGYFSYTKLYLSSELGYLKGTGELFDYVLKDLDLDASKVIHIGDNYESDVTQAANKGIRTIYFPKAWDVFRNEIENLPTNGCMKNNDEVSPLLNYKGVDKKSPGYKAMVAMCANYYFDNPFRYFHSKSDYNIDPSFVGYYALGMYLMGICDWIYRSAVENGSKRVVFTARDGYLVKKAFDVYKTYQEKYIASEYLYVSRKSMMPVFLQSTEDFYNLSIVYQQYTPNMIVELLEFCVDTDLVERYRSEWDGGIDGWDKKFVTILEYHRFMKFFLDKLYVSAKHKQIVETIKSYLQQLRDKDLIFDTGYTATIHRAFCWACGDDKQIDAIFIHSDQKKNYIMQRRGGFKVLDFCDTFPTISGLIREHIFSDLGGSCIGYELCAGEVKPQLEELEKTYADRFPIETMQKFALKFVNEYCERFADFMQCVPCKSSEAILPFEAFLGMSRNLDRKMFAASYFEDKVYGGNDNLNIEQFWLQTLLKSSIRSKDDERFSIKDIVLRGQTERRKLAFWGTGKISKSIIETYGAKSIDLFLDNNMEKDGSTFQGIVIRHPSQLVELREFFIVIACAAVSEVEEQLKELGLREYDDYVAYYEVL